MMHLLLIRHGQTSLHKRGVLVGWTNDPGLDIDGQLQAIKLAEHISAFLPPLHFAAIYTRPLPRAKQTAEIISAMLTIPIFMDNNLKDINIGELAGQSLAEVRKTAIGKRYFHDPVGVRLPDGEEIVEVSERVIPVIERIRRDYINSSVIIVSHHDVLKIILAHYTHLSLHELHSQETIPTASGRMISFSQDTVQVIPIPEY